MKFEDLKNLDLNDLQLDFNDIGSWPLVARMVTLVVLLIGLLFAGYWFHIKNELADLARIEAEEPTLKQEFERKQSRAASLEAYKEQLASMRESFGAMLRQLPDKTEVAELLVDVSQTGLASGLEFELFKPGAEIAQDFYAELPISIRVIGDYHQFGSFISGLAALPRIVTLHDIRVERLSGKDKAQGRLAMSATAKTYRYIEESQRRAAKDKKQKGRRRR